MGKQVKLFFKSKNYICTTRSLEMLHIDLFGLTRAESISQNIYEYFFRSQR